MTAPEAAPTARSPGNLLAVALTLIVSLASITAAGYAELGLMVPVPRWCYAIAITAIVIAGVMAIRPTPPSMARIFAQLALGGVVLILLALHRVDWSTRKPFLRHLARVQVGMTYIDVEAIMNGFLRGTGQQPSLREQTRTPARLVFRRSNRPRLHADQGVVTFVDGRVTSVRFLPD